MRHHLAIVALVAGLAGFPDGVASQETTDAPTGMQLPQADLRFAEDAAAGSKSEVELGELAIAKASAPEVKAYGQRMIDDHGAANDRLMQIAEQKGIELPTDLPPEAEAAQQRLDALSGAAFDLAYIEQMIIDHENAVGLFEQEASTGQDSELEQFAQDALPGLREHLERARQLSTELTGTAGVSGAPEPSVTHTAPESTTAPAAGEEMIEDEADQ